MSQGATRFTLADQMTDDEARSILREKGFCGEVKHRRACILPKDHDGDHGWPKDDERGEQFYKTDFDDCG